MTYLVHMRADADGGPIKENKTKEKEKKTYLSLDADGERGWVAMVADGGWWLRMEQGL